MWKCAYVVLGSHDMVKAQNGFRIVRHLSCSVCIILTYPLENGEQGPVVGSNLLFVIIS